MTEPKKQTNMPPGVSDSRYQRRWKPLRAALSVLVAAGTLSSLMLPAITMNRECQLQEHQHTADCQTQLVCSYDVHQHGTQCYDEDLRLVCGKVDFVVHTHDELCYDQAGELICSLPEVEAHVHEDGCYAYPVLEPGHTHEDGCYVCTYGEALTCSLPEDEEHTHTETCFEVIRGELTCTQEEREPVLAEEQVLICEKPVIIAHLHGEECYAPIEEPAEPETEPTEAETDPSEPETEPSAPETEPTEAETDPSEPETEPTEAETEPSEPETEPTEAETEPSEPETEPAEQSEPERTLICEYLEVPVHQHTEACFQSVTCSIQEHTHSTDCFPDEEPDMEDPADWEVSLTGRWNDDLAKVALKQIGNAESSTNCIEDNGETRGYTRYGHWAGTPYAPWQTLFLSFCLEYAEVPEAVIPRGSELQEWLTLLTESGLVTPAGEPQPGDLVFLDRDADGQADTGAVLVRLLDENNEDRLYTLEGDCEDAVARVAYDASQLIGYVNLEALNAEYLSTLASQEPVTHTYYGADYTVTATYGPEAGFPADVTMSVRELESGSEEYQAYVAQLPEAAIEGEVYSLRLFDITFLDAQGNKVEPAAAVDIQIYYAQAVAPGGSNCTVVHFDEENGMETLEATPMEHSEGGISGMAFSQSGFSVTAVAISGLNAEGEDVTFSMSTYADTYPVTSVTMDGIDTDTYRRWTDPVTMNQWISSFYYPGKDIISTERAGGVYMDKSVTVGEVSFTNASGQSGSVSTEAGEFLVGLSTIGSTQSVAGVESAPTDVMFVLDMSSSMYTKDGLSSARDPATVSLMVEALNESITRLNYLNPNNRIGIVVYWGFYSVYKQSGPEYSKVLLPLDRYSSDSDEFLQVDLSDATHLKGISVKSGVRNSSNETVSGSHNILNNTDDPTSGDAYVAGTYAQAGILNAMEQFKRDDIKPTLDDGTARTPVFVFMTDGKPTAATENFTSAHTTTATMGNNQEARRAAAETDFVTQLTAAYAKAEVDLKYSNGAEKTLFYSLGLGQNDNLALDILNPGNVSVTGNSCNVENADNDVQINISEKISGYWDTLLQDGSVSFDVVYYDGWTITTKNREVELKKLSNNVDFPTSKTQQKYVTQYFNAETKDQLQDAFSQIMLAISLQTNYEATWTNPNDLDDSGFVTFVDTIGEHMTVTKMEGVVLGGELHDGSSLANHLINRSGDFGTWTTPTDVGVKFVLAVGKDMGLNPTFVTGVGGNADYRTVMNVIQAAYNTGRLAYTSDTEYSNYVEWYAKADTSGNHTYLGIAHDAGECCGVGDCTNGYSDPSHYTAPAEAQYRIRTYLYQGHITPEETGSHVQTDMMYTVVWVRTNLETGQESVVFSLPNSLLPTVNYKVELDINKEIYGLSVSGSSSPAVLLYKVSLKEGTDMNTLVDQGYADVYYKMENGEYVYTEKRDENGQVVTDENGDPVKERVPSHIYFYSNDYNADSRYDTINTYSYFIPNPSNDRYYYTGPITEKEGSPTPIWTPDGNGGYVQYSGDRPVFGTGSDTKYLEKFVYYTKDADGLHTHTVWKPISSHALSSDPDHDHLVEVDGYWYVKAGTAHDMTTGTIDSNYYILKSANRTETAEWNEVPYINVNSNTGSDFIIGTMQGNNGRLMVEPFYFSGTKTLTGVDLSAVDYEFTFELYKTGSSFDVASGTLLQSVKNSDTDSDNDPKTDDIVFDPVWPFGLGNHYYVIREIPASGIISDTTEYLVTITIADDGSSIIEAKKRGTDQNLVDPSTRNISFDGADFTNSIGYELPETGGAGIDSYIFCGITLMAAAAVVYMTQRKKEKGVQF